MMLSMEREDGTQNFKAVDNYMDYLDKMTAELTGMTVEELDNLDNDEKNKLVSHYSDKIESRLDFLRSSSKQDNSVPKETKA